MQQILNKPFRFLIWIVVVIVVIGLCALWLGRSRGQNVVAKYKAELRAKGEKLSWTELGYPRPPETNDMLPQIIAAANRLGSPKFEPGTLALMDFVGPARAESCWSGPNPHFSSAAPAAAVKMTWVEFGDIFGHAREELADIRVALENPPRYFLTNPSNFLNQPTFSFVEQRKAAQWLSGDTIRALHERRLGEACTNLHALTQLVHLHENDPTLISQMIRVAIARLALADTWEALQAEGWNEEMLANLQKDLESMELANSFERGMLGERAWGETAIADMLTSSSRERMKYVRFSSAPGPVQLKSPKDFFETYVVMPFWAANADKDEMLFLQHHQRNLDSIRKLRRDVPWPEVNAELNSHQAELDKAFNSPLGRFRYLFCALGIANFTKAIRSCVRSETQRRLAVAAIALARYRLRDRRYPATLEALVPNFLSAVPIDPMSVKPLRYRLNKDRTFTLYSVGEDGRDDGGDASSATATNRYDLWSGRDAVWPVAANKGE